MGRQGLVAEEAEEDGRHLPPGDGRLGLEPAVAPAHQVGQVVPGVQAGGRRRLLPGAALVVVIVVPAGKDRAALRLLPHQHIGGEAAGGEAQALFGGGEGVVGHMGAVRRERPGGGEDLQVVVRSQRQGAQVLQVELPVQAGVVDDGEIILRPGPRRIGPVDLHRPVGGDPGIAHAGVHQIQVPELVPGPGVRPQGRQHRLRQALHGLVVVAVRNTVHQQLHRPGVIHLELAAVDVVVDLRRRLGGDRRHRLSGRPLRRQDGHGVPVSGGAPDDEPARRKAQTVCLLLLAYFHHGPYLAARLPAGVDAHGVLLVQGLTDVEIARHDVVLAVVELHLDGVLPLLRRDQAVAETATGQAVAVGVELLQLPALLVPAPELQQPGEVDLPLLEAGAPHLLPQFRRQAGGQSHEEAGLGQVAALHHPSVVIHHLAVGGRPAGVDHDVGGGEHDGVREGEGRLEPGVVLGLYPPAAPGPDLHLALEGEDPVFSQGTAAFRKGDGQGLPRRQAAGQLYGKGPALRVIGHGRGDHLAMDLARIVPLAGQSGVLEDEAGQGLSSGVLNGDGVLRSIADAVLILLVLLEGGHLGRPLHPDGGPGRKAPGRGEGDRLHGHGEGGSGGDRRPRQVPVAARRQGPGALPLPVLPGRDGVAQSGHLSLVVIGCRVLRRQVGQLPGQFQVRVGAHIGVADRGADQHRGLGAAGGGQAAGTVCGGILEVELRLVAQGAGVRVGLGDGIGHLPGDLPVLCHVLERLLTGQGEGDGIFRPVARLGIGDGHPGIVDGVHGVLHPIGRDREAIGDHIPRPHAHARLIGLFHAVRAGHRQDLLLQGGQPLGPELERAADAAAVVGAPGEHEGAVAAQVPGLGNDGAELLVGKAGVVLEGIDVLIAGRLLRRRHPGAVIAPVGDGVVLLLGAYRRQDREGIALLRGGEKDDAVGPGGGLVDPGPRLHLLEIFPLAVVDGAVGRRLHRQVHGPGGRSGLVGQGRRLGVRLLRRLRRDGVRQGVGALRRCLPLRRPDRRQAAGQQRTQKAQGQQPAQRPAPGVLSLSFRNSPFFRGRTLPAGWGAVRPEPPARRCLASAQLLLQQPQQLPHVQRLGDVGVHAALQALVDVL